MEKTQAMSDGKAGEANLINIEDMQRREFELEQQYQQIQSATDMTDNQRQSAMDELRQRVLQLTAEAETLASQLGH